MSLTLLFAEARIDLKPALRICVAVALLLLGLDVAWSTPRCDGRLLRYQIDESQEQTLTLLRARDFSKLQARMDGFLASYDAGKLSDEELFFEFGAFDRWAPSLTPIFQEWLELLPKSYAAHQAMALHTSAVAWKMRGPELAKNTSRQQMEGFMSLLAEARSWAVKATKLHPKPVLSYGQLVYNSKALPVDDDLYKALGLKARGPFKDRSRINPRPDVVPLLEAGNWVQPDNVVVRVAYVSVLTPSWGGSLEALEEYSRTSSHPGLPADRMAAVLYAAAMEIGYSFEFTKEPDQAVVFYELAGTACRLNQPLMNIARIRIGQKRWADALAAADAAIAMVPGSPAGQRYKAYALSGLGRHNEAVVLLQKLTPEGNPDVAYFLGEYYAHGEGGLSKDLREARRLFSIAARAGDERAAKRLQSMPAQ
jgi:TPR repeat protein